MLYVIVKTLSCDGGHLEFLTDARNKYSVKGHPSNSLLLILLNSSVNLENNDTNKYFSSGSKLTLSCDGSHLGFQIVQKTNNKLFMRGP